MARKLRQRLQALYAHFIETGDAALTKKVRELAPKLEKKEFGIAFCGHFSAGKSRMINALLGEKLLPSSPIPTSANLVKVRAGEEYAEVHFRDGKPRRYLAPYDYELVKSFCKDGDKIETIELSHAGGELPTGVVIMDTPGIDSADDAHRLATEDAIHLADVIFFVMDYNHVQSALNFGFTKALTDAGKELYLVVNQIDKHRSEELPFSEFRTGLEKAFKAWGVKQAGVFYTSLREEAHVENEFPKLKAFLKERLEEKDKFLVQSIDHALDGLVEEAVRKEMNAYGEKRTEAEALLEKILVEERERYAVIYDKIVEEKRGVRSVREQKAEFLADTQKILASAYLMPFETRALAEQYLEACAENFKVGNLFTLGRKQKTEAERAKRKAIFWAEVQKKTEMQIDWHMRTFLKDFVRKSGIEDKALERVADAFASAPAENMLEKVQNAGAVLTKDGSYVMSYTVSIEKEIKLAAERALKRVLEKEILPRLEQRRKEREAARAAQMEALGEYARARKILEALHEKENAARAVLHAVQEKEGEAHPEIFISPTLEVEMIAGAQVREESVQEHAPKREEVVEESAATREEHTENLAHWAEKLAYASSLMTGIDSLTHLAAELKERSARLRGRKFLVTLFGAFSAGKSSFANALLGRALLPVSPNPTTAAINKILPVDEEHPHGTVRIKLKDEAMLCADLNRAFAAFGMRTENAKEAVTLAREIIKDAQGELQATFLRAFARGAEEALPHLGEVLACGLAEFPLYAAQEEKSCFVEWIEVYYDCPLTARGITLVDTPGADSINARHTNMAFDFIRKSDAILFVTYYNHAFSRADREFLMQLGRVKDAFPLDKMFFLVNAIDLAEDTREAEDVLHYVRENLKAFGVRKPQLYPISSQQLLVEKQKNPDVVSEFEEAFYHFVFHDLAGIAAKLAEKDYERAKETMADWIELSLESKETRAKRLEELQAAQTKAEVYQKAQSVTPLKKRMEQEQKELLHYVKQRIFLRFEEFFREAFHAGALGKKDTQAALKQAMQELLDGFSFDFAQELRATMLRMEAYWGKLAQDFQAKSERDLREIQADFTLTRVEAPLSLELNFEGLLDVSASDFSKELALFKSAERFFERGERKQMVEALEARFRVLTDTSLERQGAKLRNAWETGTECAFQELIAQMDSKIESFYADRNRALTQTIPTEKLRTIYAQL